MLEIGALPGNYSWGGPGLTLAEARSHYTLWAILKSPLLLGADASRMSEPILDILRNKDLRKIQEDPLGKQARQLDTAYPGAHADTETAAVLRPCNSSDSQQLWGSNYGSCPSGNWVGSCEYAPAPIPMIRNAGSTTHCVSAQCQPANASTPLTVRQCDDWNHVSAAAIFYPCFPGGGRSGLADTVLAGDRTPAPVSAGKCGTPEARGSAVISGDWSAAARRTAPTRTRPSFVSPHPQSTTPPCSWSSA